MTAPEPETLAAGDTLNLFFQGKLAVCLGQPKYGKMIEDVVKDGTLDKPFKYMFVMIPGDKPGFVPAFYGSVVFNTKDPERIKYAKEYVRFASSEQFARACEAGLFIPVRTALSDELYSDNSDFQYFKLISKYGTGNLQADVPGYTEIRNKLYPELQAVFTGGKTPQQALDDFAKEGDEIIEKYNN